MSSVEPDRTVAIVGAGVTGLAARWALHANGWNTLTLEKSRGSGGRIATRRGENWIADLGAQFTASKLQEWRELLIAEGDEVLPVRITGDAGGDEERYPRWVHRVGMSALAKSLLKKGGDAHPVRFGTRVVRLEPAQDREGWLLHTQEGSVLSAHAVLVTAPLPQALDLVVQSGLTLAEQDREVLEKIQYSPCLAAVFNFPHGAVKTEGLPPLLKRPSAALEGIYDQPGKGLRCPAPTWVVHASADWSRAHWGDPDERVLEGLWSEVRSALAFRDPQGPPCDPPNGAQLHRWRFCQPERVLAESFWNVRLQSGREARTQPALLLAGDSFGRSSVEGAFASGLAAGRSLGRGQDTQGEVPC